MKITLLPLLFSGFVWLHADTAVWDGGVGDGNFFNPLNWDIRPDQAGLQPPPAGFISDEGKTDRHLLLEMAAARGEQRRLDLNGRKVELQKMTREGQPLREGADFHLVEEGNGSILRFLAVKGVSKR